jgi:hypothetical protein
VDSYDVFHTKGIPYRRVPQLPRWFDELKDISNRAGLEPGVALDQQQPQQQQPRQTASYSKTTGRLNEAPSRAMSRSGPTAASRAGKPMSRSGVFTGGINKAPDNEALVMELLSQILQTDSISSIQQWLVAANDREKDLVSDMIRAALATEQQMSNGGAYYPEDDQFLANQNAAAGSHYDRLVVDNGAAAAGPQEPMPQHNQQPMMQHQDVMKLPDINKPQSARSVGVAQFRRSPPQHQKSSLDVVPENDQEYVEYRSFEQQPQ